MAYIDKETVSKIRTALKNDPILKNIKFSVRKENSIALHVTIMKSQYFEEGGRLQVNHYHIKNSDRFDDKQKEILMRVREVIEEAGDYFDKSDAMTDYFHCAFYYSISVGKWDKPHEKVA